MADRAISATCLTRGAVMRASAYITARQTRQHRAIRAGILDRSRTRQYRYWEDMRGDRHHASPMHTVAGFPYVADGMPADCADCSPGYYVEAYRETLDRLRDAQARYELNRDDRASDAAVRDAIRDVLVARADLEHLRRRARRAGLDLAY